MLQSVCDRGIALVREQIVKTWRLQQDTALKKSFGQLVLTSPLPKLKDPITQFG